MNPTDRNTVRSIYAAFARGDLDTIRAALAPDVLIEQPEVLPWGGRYRGHDGFNAFIAAMFRRVQPTLTGGELFDSGEHIIHVGRFGGTIIANDHEYDICEVHVWDLHDGKVRSLTVYPDTTRLVAALTAGLPRYTTS